MRLGKKQKIDTFQKKYQDKLSVLQKQVNTMNLDNRRRKKNDSWLNAVAGLGGSQDKRKETSFGAYTRLTEEELANLYVGDGYGSRIVDIVADDMTREWIELDNDENEIITNKLTQLHAEAVFNEALTWQRLFGGSLIIMGAMDSRELDEPLNPKAVKDIEWLKVVDKTQVKIGLSEFEEDPQKPDFGQVRTYSVQFAFGRSQTVNVHRSRVIPFYGKAVPNRIIEGDQDFKYWGSSALQAPWNQLQDYGGVTSSIANLMYELIISVFKFDDLANMIADGNEKLLLNRMEIINITKSMINAVMLDSNGEDFDRNTASIAGVPDVIDRYMMNLSGVTGIPVTRLFGRSPAGQNATGEADMRNYYDMVRSKQKIELSAPLQKLVDLIAVIEKVPGEHPITFNPLPGNSGTGAGIA
jgi:phage-related protein (TIGR01555 family)